MIKVKFNGPTTEPALSRWNTWVEAGRAAAAELLRKADAGEPIEINEQLYKAMREEIFAGFHGKCAYCEAKFVLDQRGDVDHFRPKGRVTDDKNKPVQIPDGAGGQRNHPGYFWLAYEWTNLLPACSRCNRPGKYGDEAGAIRQVGKWDHFPVQGQRASRPEEVAQEHPLLLHPLFDDPKDHFTFDPATGRLIPKTPEARECDRILDLNREGLPEARRDVYYAVLARAGQLKQARVNNDGATVDRHLGFLIQHKEGTAEYSVAGQHGWEEHKAIIRAEIEALTAQLDL